MWLLMWFNCCPTMRKWKRENRFNLNPYSELKVSFTFCDSRGSGCFLSLSWDKKYSRRNQEWNDEANALYHSKANSYSAYYCNFRISRPWCSNVRYSDIWPIELSSCLDAMVIDFLSLRVFGRSDSCLVKILFQEKMVQNMHRYYFFTGINCSRKTV